MIGRALREYLFSKANDCNELTNIFDSIRSFKPGEALIVSSSMAGLREPNLNCDLVTMLRSASLAAGVLGQLSLSRQILFTGPSVGRFNPTPNPKRIQSVNNFTTTSLPQCSIYSFAAFTEIGFNRKTKDNKSAVIQRWSDAGATDKMRRESPLLHRSSRMGGLKRVVAATLFFWSWLPIICAFSKHSSPSAVGAMRHHRLSELRNRGDGRASVAPQGYAQ